MNTTTGPKWYNLLTAFVILGLFVYFTWDMYFYRAAFIEKERVDIWKNSYMIYSGFLTFAAGAAGVLLGTQIQAGRVAEAQKQADTSQQKADQAAKEKAAAEIDKGKVESKLEIIKGGHDQAIRQLESAETILKGGGKPADTNQATALGILKAIQF
jgi:hypothetical protein